VPATFYMGCVGAVISGEPFKMLFVQIEIPTD